MRTRMSNGGLLDIVDTIVLPCEVGYAKLDPRIYTVALQRIGADPVDVLFIDDTPGHVATAETLGMAGHVHTNAEDTKRSPGWRPTPWRGVSGSRCGWGSGGAGVLG